MIGWGLAAVVGGALVVAFVKLGRYHTPSFHAAWAAFAAGRGTLTTARGGVELRTERHFVRVVAAVGPDRTTFLARTVVWAQWGLVAGPTFDVADREHARPFAPPTWQPLTTGDAAFDARFVSAGEADDAPAFARALGERERALLVRLPPLRLLAGDGGVTLDLPGIIEDHATLETAIELIGLIGSLDVEAAIAALRALPDAKVHEPREGAKERQPVWAQLAGKETSLAYLAHHGRRITVAHAPLPVERPSGWFHIDPDGHPDAVTESSTLPSALLPLLATVPDAVLRFGNGRVDLSMDGTVLEATRLLAAVDLCEALAAASAEGVYR